MFTLASASCALAQDADTLIAARAAQRAGAAFVMPLAFTLLSTALPPEHRGKAIGLFSGVTGLATLMGPFLGGAIAAEPFWAWIFWINVPIGLITIVLVLLRIEENQGPTTGYTLSASYWSPAAF
ncbi:MFS family permease [Nonomuraea thailandensis]|uniref:MFS family permease n=1 Tax=Nonomuraea thailandensis TaxID=1188745 RepID=A0A9X2GE37_9ACTN|nr:MFS family permease [Nonomuraea thailandensis]